MDGMEYTRYAPLTPVNQPMHWLGRYPGADFPRTDERESIEWLSRQARALVQRQGSCPFPQAYLLQWLGDELDFIHAAGTPPCAVAATLDAAYLRWIGLQA